MIWSLIVGLVIGVIAKFLMPGKDPGGLVVTILLGISGAMVANFVGSKLGWYSFDETAGIAASVIGAVVLLSIYRGITKRRHTISHR